MTRVAIFIRHLAAFALACSVAAIAAAVPAQETPAAVRVQTPGGLQQLGRVVIVDSTQASETREKLRELLANYSPSLGQVLKLDPTLLTNADYLAPYPALSQFLSQHPEVSRDPSYFLEHVRMPASRPDRTEDDRVREYWQEGFAALMVFIGFLFVAAILAWLIKMLVDYRRWLRLSKVQADVHNKLLDRFAANEELLAYVQSHAGQRFLESSPISLDPAAPVVAAPLRRIMWTIEAGCVLAAAGVGLLLISRWVAEVSQPMLALGVFAVSLGAGCALAAAVSYLLSRRLGLFSRAPTREDTGSRIA